MSLEKLQSIRAFLQTVLRELIRLEASYPVRQYVEKALNAASSELHREIIRLYDAGDIYILRKTQQEKGEE